MHGDSFYAALRIFSEVQLQLGKKKKKEFTAELLALSRLDT